MRYDECLTQLVLIQWGLFWDDGRCPSKPWCFTNAGGADHILVSRPANDCSLRLQALQRGSVSLRKHLEGFPLRSYILWKQENNKSLLMSEHSPLCFPPLALCAGWEGPFHPGKPPAPELCRQAVDALARAVASGLEMRKETWLGPFFSSLLSHGERLQLVTIVARSDKHCRPANGPAKPAIPYVGQ